jgi:hypothetical protein
VRALLARPAGLSRTARQALGYSELLDHIEHGTPLDAALATAIQRTRRFARRQQRWFRRDPRIEWLPAGDASDTAPGGGAASETAAGPVGAPPIAAGGAAAAQAGGTAASGPEDPKRTEAGDGDPTENALARLSSLLGD